MMLLRPEGLLPSRQRQAELHEREGDEEQYEETHGRGDRQTGGDDMTEYDDDARRPTRCADAGPLLRRRQGDHALRRPGGQQDVDFTIPRGSIVSLIGPNGAGKTTFFNQLTGMLEPTSGDIVFDGSVDRRPHAARDRRARHRPHVPEHPPVRRHDRPSPT